MSWYVFFATITMAAIVTALAMSAERIFSLPLRLISKISGWYRLGELFPAHSDGKGVRFKCCTVCIDKMCYRSCITASINGDFLTLSPIFPFRPYHPAISIPRDRLRSVPEKARLFRLEKFEIAGTNKSIWLPSRVAHEL